jgi:5S rRNA maturation endonuclease (ribonuclease M5)
MKLTADTIRKFLESRFSGQQIGYRRELSLRCPFHDDGTPSLSFNVEKGVWKCHAGCGGGGLVDFEQKLNGGTREEAGARIDEVIGADHLFESQKSKPVAIYTYHDAQGRVVFEKLRYEPKRFVQRHPISEGRYEYKLDGVEKPLYRLPELLTANEILVCEGEKDCDNVLAAFPERATDNIRIAATTNFGGAGKWSEEDSRYFAGKRVVILPDNDEPGRRHAEIVARSVQKFAVGVKVVHLPGLPEKGDVSDWLADGHTTHELIAEIKTTTPWRPKETPHVMLAEGAQFGATAPPEVEWIVEGVIQKGGNGIVTGEPKAGKSLLMIDLLLAVATGTPWLGFSVSRRVKCALISREDYPGMTQQRLARLFRGTVRRMDFEGWLWINTRWQTPTFLLEDNGHVSQLIEEMRSENVEFACFDVFRRLHGQDENDNTAIQKILDQLARIQTEVGCALALVHHTTKDANGSIFRRIRGATAIHGWTEWALGVSVTNNEEPGRDWIRKVEFETKAACPADPVYFRIEAPGDSIRLILAEPPGVMRPRPLATAASYMKMGGRV